MRSPYLPCTGRRTRLQARHHAKLHPEARAGSAGVHSPTVRTAPPLLTQDAHRGHREGARQTNIQSMNAGCGRWNAIVASA